MANLPVLSGVEVVKILQKFGWTVDRQTSSHIIMTKEGEFASLFNTKSPRGCERNFAEFDPRCESNGRSVC